VSRRASGDDRIPSGSTCRKRGNTCSGERITICVGSTVASPVRHTVTGAGLGTVSASRAAGTPGAPGAINRCGNRNIFPCAAVVIVQRVPRVRFRNETVNVGDRAFIRAESHIVISGNRKFNDFLNSRTGSSGGQMLHAGYRIVF